MTMVRTIGPVTLISAIWNVIARAWRTTRAPNLIRFSCKLVNDQSVIASGKWIQRSKVVRYYARWAIPNDDISHRRSGLLMARSVFS